MSIKTCSAPMLCHGLQCVSGVDASICVWPLSIRQAYSRASARCGDSASSEMTIRLQGLAIWHSCRQQGLPCDRSCDHALVSLHTPDVPYSAVREPLRQSHTAHVSCNRQTKWST